MPLNSGVWKMHCNTELFPQSYTSAAHPCDAREAAYAHGALAQMPDHCPVWNRDVKSSKFTNFSYLQKESAAVWSHSDDVQWNLTAVWSAVLATDLGHGVWEDLIWHFCASWVGWISVHSGTVFIYDKSSGNHTTGSRSNSLVGHTHPSQSCQVLTLTLWIPGQTLIAATSTASKIRLYLGC